MTKLAKIIKINQMLEKIDKQGLNEMSQMTPLIVNEVASQDQTVSLQNTILSSINELKQNELDCMLNKVIDLSETNPKTEESKEKEKNKILNLKQMIIIIIKIM